MAVGSFRKEHEFVTGTSTQRILTDRGEKKKLNWEERSNTHMTIVMKMSKKQELLAITVLPENSCFLSVLSGLLRSTCTHESGSCHSFITNFLSFCLSRFSFYINNKCRKEVYRPRYN